ncbi:MAG TPA: aspartyl protease, partial [Patescibacteria group bacterium]|nr:aspartyl protease [Patescibacteria group bacterium]
PTYVQQFSLADGRMIKRSLGSAFIQFEDKELAVPVILGRKDDTALLGITTLESFGLMLDPFKRRIYQSKLMMG